MISFYFKLKQFIQIRAFILRRIAGNYATLDGGLFENIFLLLSGGMRDQYFVNITTSKIQHRENDVSQQELREIMQIAFERNFSVSCTCVYENGQIPPVNKYSFSYI
jgi:hypothetical protein